MLVVSLTVLENLVFFLAELPLVEVLELKQFAVEHLVEPLESQTVGLKGLRDVLVRSRQALRGDWQLGFGLRLLGRASGGRDVERLAAVASSVGGRGIRFTARGLLGGVIAKVHSLFDGAFALPQLPSEIFILTVLVFLIFAVVLLALVARLAGPPGKRLVGGVGRFLVNRTGVFLDLLYVGALFEVLPNIIEGVHY